MRSRRAGIGTYYVVVDNEVVSTRRAWEVEDRLGVWWQAPAKELVAADLRPF